MKYLILIAFISVFTLLSCNNQNNRNVDTNGEAVITQDSLNKTNLGPNKKDQYKTNVNFDMTLSEVAKKNSISLNYLKSELGIPSSIKHDYQLKSISKNFQFDIEDIERIITQYHDKNTARIKSNVSKSTK